MKTPCGMILVLATAVTIGQWALCGLATAQEAPLPYDSLNAGEEAHRYYEAMRLEQIRRQIGLIQRMNRRYPASYGAYGFYQVPQPIGQWRFQSGPNRWESHPVYEEPIFAPRRRRSRGPREF